MFFLSRFFVQSILFGQIQQGILETCKSEPMKNIDALKKVLVICLTNLNQCMEKGIIISPPTNTAPVINASRFLKKIICLKMYKKFTPLAVLLRSGSIENLLIRNN